jgi:cytochrome c biogenesis protein CcdA
MTISSASGLYLPLIFALGTGIPVIIFAYLLAYSASKVGKAYNIIKRIEKVMRVITGVVFILTGTYYALIYLKLFYCL